MQLDIAGEADIGQPIEEAFDPDPHLLTAQPLAKTTMFA